MKELKYLCQNYYPVLVPAGFLLLYLTTLTSHHSEAEDAIAYAHRVSLGDPLLLFHPNHLLFESFSFAFYKLLSLFLPSIDVVTAMQILQSLAGAVSLYLCIQIGRQLALDSFWILLTALCIGFSYGFWAYSVEADTYILPLPFILLAIKLLLTGESPDKPNFYLIKMAVYLSIATLIYQQHVLLFPVIVVTLAIFELRNGKSSPMALMKKILLFGGVGVVITVGSYLAIALLNPKVGEINSLGDAVLWSLGHGRHGLYTEPGLISLLKSAIGFSKTLWGTSFLFGYDWFKDLVFAVIPGAAGLEEIYLAESLSDFAKHVSLLFILPGILALLGCIIVVILSITRRDQALTQHPLPIFSLVMLLIYTIFNTIYFPDNLEFWIATVPVFFIYLGFELSRATSYAVTAKYLSFTLLAGLLIPNAVGSIIPQSSDRGNFWGTHTHFYIEQLNDDDIAIVNCGWGCTPRLRMWASAEIYYLHELSPSELEDILTRWQEKRLFISSWLWSPPKQATLVRWNSNERHKKRLAEIVEAVKPRMRLVYKDDTQDIYQLDR